MSFIYEVIFSVRLYNLTEKCKLTAKRKARVLGGIALRFVNLHKQGSIKGNKGIAYGVHFVLVVGYVNDGMVPAHIMLP